MIIDSHCHAWGYWPYQEENDKNLILGKNLKTLLKERGKID